MVVQYNRETFDEKENDMKSKMLILGLMLIALAGCRLQANTQLTETAQVTQISGAQTLEASLSQTPDVTPTSQPTWTPSATSTVTQGVTPSPSATFRPTATSGASVGSCDDARFVADVTVPDDKEMDPGETFTKTWRLENAGTCEWTTDYSVSFVSGDKMGGDTYEINENVAPGETHDISIDMKAPFEAGTYRGDWTIKNENGISFGATFYVQIVVSTSATPTGTATNTPTASVTPTSAPTPSSTPSPSPSPTKSPSGNQDNGS